MREGFLTLLPEDPDASAERLQKELSARLGLHRLGVVITDTFGRPWREGVVDVAIGCAGLPALMDLRGTVDDRGTELETTVVAFADAVAAASGLVMTKTARVPAALVRGLDGSTGDAPPGPARALVRRREDDLFRESALVAVVRRAADANARSARATCRRDLVEEAVARRERCRPRGGLDVRRVDSAAARRRLLAVVADADDPLRSAPVLIVPCVGCAQDATSSGPRRRSSSPPAPRSGRSCVALHAQGLGVVRGTRTSRSTLTRVRAALALGAELASDGHRGGGPDAGGRGLAAPPSERRPMTRDGAD